MARRKGNEAEREVAALLETWWRRLDPAARFVRTPLSGGWTHGRDDFGARGDLMSKSDPPFPWCVEVKRRERWNLDRVLRGQASPLWGWWRQACDDAAAARLAAMLWARQNNGEWIVLVPVGVIIPHPDRQWSCPLPVSVVPVLFRVTTLLASDPRGWLPR